MEGVVDLDEFEEAFEEGLEEDLMVPEEEVVLERG